MESLNNIRPMLEQTLRMIITPDQQLIEKGQTQLQAFELLDTYALALTEITVDNTRDVSIRQLASVLLRKYVNKHWTRDSENFVEPEVSEHVCITSMMILLTRIGHNKLDEILLTLSLIAS